MNQRSAHAMTLATLSLALSSTTALAHGDEDHAPARHYDATRAEDTAFGREGDPKKVTRTVKPGMADTMRFTPSDITVRHGQIVRFVVCNDGKLLHEMVLGTAEALKAHAELMRKFPEMEHADANMAHVAPGASGEIVWQFTRPGRFEFACLQPGHFEAGMIGKVDVL